MHLLALVLIRHCRGGDMSIRRLLLTSAAMAAIALLLAGARPRAVAMTRSPRSRLPSGPSTRRSRTHCSLSAAGLARLGRVGLGRPRPGAHRASAPAGAGGGRRASAPPGRPARRRPPQRRPRCSVSASASPRRARRPSPARRRHDSCAGRRHPGSRSPTGRRDGRARPGPRLAGGDATAGLRARRRRAVTASGTSRRTPCVGQLGRPPERPRGRRRRTRLVVGQRRRHRPRSRPAAARPGPPAPGPP